MKRFLTILGGLASAAALLGGAFLLSANATETKATGPQSSSIKSTQTINLNDTAESAVRTYYKDLNGRNLSGTDLLKALRPILQDFTYYSYDDVWQIYEITDREWNLSPASSTTYGTYNSSTNKITNYAYGENADPKNNPYIHCLYRNLDSDGNTVESGRITAYGDHTQQGGFNREHVWCQSRGFKAPSGANGPAGTDVHHLIAGDGFVNGNDNQHNNNPYGFVDKTKTHYDASTMGKDYGLYCAGNLGGKPVNSSSSDVGTKVFEPQDSDKGDIARACFYMVACYNNLSGTETITQYNPDLTLCDYATSNSTSEISSEVGHAVGMGILRDLLAWHRMDPVDDYEIHRNNLIYENYQHNRNPFIDYPDWVEAIWGSVTLNETTHKVTYDSTPVGYADPENDDVRTVGESWATVSSIAVSGQTTAFTVGDTFAFGGTVTATMSDSSLEDVTSKCTFSGYNMSTAGNQTVTVTHTPSGKTTTYAITVSEPVVPVSIAVSGQKTAFTVGDTWSFGGTVTLTYSDSSHENVTDGCTFSGYNMSATGNQTVTVTHTATSLSTTYSINVAAQQSSSSSSSSTPAPVAEDGYRLVRNASELREGDQVILGAFNADKYYGMKNQYTVVDTTYYRVAGEISSPVEDVLTIDGSEGLKVVTLGKDSGSWTLSTDEGFLRASLKTGKNWLASAESVADAGDAARWTIDIDSDGNATIVALDTSVPRFMRYNASYTRFACYTSGSSVSILPMIFKSYNSEADTYGKAFIDTYTKGCKESGIGSTIDWSSASTAYNGLTTRAKGILSGLSATSGTAYRHQCVARYDYIVGKYGTGTYANFMSRAINVNNGSLNSGFPNKVHQYGALIAIGTIGVTCIGFFFLSRKKKRA